MLSKIKALLHELDIEGYIDFGAPDDEYESEAEAIDLAINDLSASERSSENITAIVSAIWAKSFELGEDEMALRMPAINKLVDRLI